MATEEQTTQDTHEDMRNGFYHRLGQKLTISSRLVSDLSFMLAKAGYTGNPTGDITFTIRKVSDDSLLGSKVWGDAADLAGTTLAWYTATLDSPVFVNEEVRISAEYSGGDTLNVVRWGRAGSDVKAGEQYTRYGPETGNVWQDRTGDATYKYTYTALSTPTVTTNPATEVGPLTATLKGTLEDDGGEDCDVRFQYGETSDYGIDTVWQSGKESVIAFEQAITGLDPNTTYHFRAQARNSAGTVNGADRTFTTLILIEPTVTTDPATSITKTTATLNGELDDDGNEACDCGFEYGETTDYGTTTATESKETGETFSQAISGLTLGKHYHFRAIATNSAGISYGSDRTFFAKLKGGNINIDQRIYQHVERIDR